MNIQNTDSSNFIIENKNRIIFLFVLFLLSSMRMFGQTTEVSKEVPANDVIIISNTQPETRIATTETQIDFVSWFMGSRQSQINESETGHSTNTAATKKQILTSGITPNKVLYRTFMKRVISQDSAIA